MHCDEGGGGGRDDDDRIVLTSYRVVRDLVNGVACVQEAYATSWLVVRGLVQRQLVQMPYHRPSAS